MIPVELGAGPIPAVKQSYLRVVHDPWSGEIVGAEFLPTNVGQPFPRIARSECHCPDGTRHEQPEPDSTCGFWGYAIWQPDHSTASFGTSGTARLDVLFSGRIIEHERGFRAECQEVATVTMFAGAGHCATCEKERHELMIRSHYAFYDQPRKAGIGWGLDLDGRFGWLCRLHLVARMDADDLSLLLDCTPVVLVDPTPEEEEAASAYVPRRRSALIYSEPAPAEPKPRPSRRRALANPWTALVAAQHSAYVTACALIDMPVAFMALHITTSFATGWAASHAFFRRRHP